MTSLSAHQIAYLELLVRREALRFGSFVTKSGRETPYFINTGSFYHASDMQLIGNCYARRLLEIINGPVDIIYGPAYKGIPLALATAQAYRELSGRDVSWAFDRKEVKDHGEGGRFVGAPLEKGARVALVDDLITAGTALRASLEALAAVDVQVLGAVVSVDREEVGPAGRASARQEIEEDCGVSVYSLISISEIVEYLLGHQVDGKRALDEAGAAKVREHLQRYGC